MRKHDKLKAMERVYALSPAEALQVIRKFPEHEPPAVSRKRLHELQAVIKDMLDTEDGYAVSEELAWVESKRREEPKRRFSGLPKIPEVRL